MLQKCGREQGHQHDGAKPLEGVHFWSGNEAKVLEGIAKRLPWEAKCSQSVGRYCKSNGNEVSEIKVSDQRGRRLSGRPSVDFIKQKCRREVPLPPAWRETIGRCSLLEAKCCKRVEGSCSTHHHGAKPLEGVHF